MAKPNTGKSQGTFGAFKSLLPGGQKANFGAVGQSTKNFAGEVSGVYDVNRGIKEIGKGNIAGGLGRIGLGVVGLVPGVGAAAKAVTAASKVAKASKFVTAASKARPVQAVVSRTAPVVRPAVKPIVGANRLITKANTPLRAGTTKLGKVGAQFTSPAVLAALGAGVVGGLTAGTPGSTAAQAFVPSTGAVQGPGLGGRDQGLGGTLGTRPGTGGTGGTGGPGGTGGGTTPPAGGGTGGLIDGESAILQETVPGGGGKGPDTSEDIEVITPTTSTGGTTTVGVPGDVQVAESQLIADKAANASRAFARQAGFREAFAQGIEGVQGSAADIIGGRSQAILGQGITGQRRNLEVAKAEDVQRKLAEDEASRKAYSDAVAAAYARQAQAILDAAKRKSALSAQIKRIG
jgi:hypothetical protein